MQSTALLNCSSVVKGRGSGIFSNAKFMLFIFLLISKIPIESLHTADENNDSEQINDNLEPGHKKSETEKKRFQKEKKLHSKCRKLGITFEPPLDNETEEQTRKRCRRNSELNPLVQGGQHLGPYCFL
jgi:hypothetical protein